ncbi:MAG: DUF6531 domain-containing protein [Tannerellaceae bacterium]|nr:DUF6531 domain-containing protein [Tannerellaceae bacterium]
MSEHRNNMSNNNNMVEQIGSNLNHEVENVTQSINEIFQENRTINNNSDASNVNKAASLLLSGIDGALSITALKEGAAIKIGDSLLTPIYQKLSFLKGMASLPVLKQTDPVMGVDIHNVVIPPSPVVPMPHPYIGMLFRPKDYISCMLLTLLPPPQVSDPVTEESTNDEITKANLNKAATLLHTATVMFLSNMGASVKIGDFHPRAVAGTPTQSIPHIPMGTGFSPGFVTIEKNVGHSFLGSLFVNADGEPLSGALSHLHNDCWDVGVKNLHEEEGVPKLMRFYVPSGTQTSIPQGNPVLVNPVPTPLNPSGQTKKLFKAGLGKLNKVFRKNFQKVLNKIADNPKLKKAMGGCPGLTKLSKTLGTGVSHPADVASGHFYTDNIDFTLPGVLPVEFERTYYSYSDYQGPLGTGWHHRYDMAIAFDHEEGLAAFRLEDGRTTGFEIPAPGSFFFNRREKFWLHRTLTDEFYVTDNRGLIYRFTGQAYQNPHNKSEAHLLQSISNRNGYSLRFTYQADGVLKTMTDTAGRELLFENDGKGHITAVTAPAPEGDGRVILSQYEYDNLGRLITQTDALGHPMRFEYNGTLLTRETWRNNLSWHIFYDGKDKDAKCIEITGDNNLMHYRLDYVAPDCTVVTNSLGYKTTYYHRRGFVTKRIDPNGGVFEFVYNPDNELEWTTDPLGNGTGETHDEWGNIVTKTEADSGFTYLQYEHPEFPYLPTSATDAVGGRWKWEYDTAGNLVKRTDPLGAETQFEYTDGLLTAITGAQGQHTHLEYDLEGNLVRTIAPDDSINTWQYDRWGNCIRSENAKGGVTHYQYNLLGDITEVKEADGNIRTLVYDTEGNVIHAKDNDRDVKFTYRGVNKMASRTERGATLRFLYDTEDQLKAVENENGERYTFRLNPQGEVIEEKGFDGLTRTYQRDLGGRVVRTQKPGGTEIGYEYDPVGRVTKVTYQPGSKHEHTEMYGYRTDGALIRAVNRDAEVILERDILGRVTRETCNGQSVCSTYDPAGNRTHITSTLGADIQAEYNLMGDLVSLSGGGWQNRYQRDQFGLETVREMMGGVRSETTRDRLGRVTGHQTSKNNRRLSEKSYLWGTNDKLLGIAEGSKEIRFEYDGWGNLSATVFADGKTEFRNPDRTGNLFESLDRMDRTYAKGGQLIRTDRWEYKYDKEGNLVRKKDKHGQTWRYEWNDSGMLESVKRPDGISVRFKYDALGRRIEKRFGKQVVRWLWDGNVPLNEEREVIYPDYSPEAGHYDRIEKQPTITWVFEEGTFVPTAKLAGQTQLSIVTNYLGTPEAMYSEQGETVWNCELNSYGKVRSYEGQSKTACPFRYQGQYEDAETGLYYNRFRYYSPEEGIYISQDPIRLGGGSNLYEYVGDVNGYIDPYGLSRLQRSDGHWTGKPGDSTWKSNKTDVNSITKNKGIEFKDGYPDFSPYSKGNYNFKDLDGTDKDFDKVYERVMKQKKLNSKNAAKEWLKAKGLTPHHHQNGRTIQLIPTALHKNVPHEGGASKLRKMNKCQNS